MSSLRKRRLAELNRRKTGYTAYVPNNTASSGVIIGPPDGTLFAIIIALAVFGLMFVFSAGAPEGIEFYNFPAYYALRHLGFLVAGFVMMAIMSKIDYRHYKKYMVPFTIATILLIAATYVPGLGKTSYGASRWLVGVPIQPSELAKIATIFLISSALSQSKNLFSPSMTKNLMLIGIMIVLILKQPNLSIAIIITLITATTMLVGGVSSMLISIGGVAAIPFLFFYIQSNEYQLKRILGWLDPWKDPQGLGYNLIQSQYAIGSGALLGSGFGHSKQKLFWLPFRHTDFIFAVIAEELGFLGCLVLIGLFLAFIHRGFLIADRCDDRFGKLVATGITFSIGVQAFINIGVATGVLPVTGVTLPLISYGGSSTMVTLMMMGILLNISKKRIKRISQPEDAYARAR